jgi:hypothetical protein
MLITSVRYPFIRYGDLYSGPLRQLFRSATDPAQIEENSLKIAITHVRRNQGQQTKPIPYHRADNLKSTMLPDRGSSVWDKKLTLHRRMEIMVT